MVFSLPTCQLSLLRAGGSLVSLMRVKFAEQYPVQSPASAGCEFGLYIARYINIQSFIHQLLYYFYTGYLID